MASSKQSKSLKSKQPAATSKKPKTSKFAKTPHVHKETESGVSNKDYKLLWGRAAARCAFADCRKVLTEAKGVATYGNVCHIVGESPNGPRGNSILTKEQRNSYPNLVLLCSHHHDVIDVLPSGPKAYPVDLLHQIKTEHELWVEGTLAPQTDAAQLVYASVVDDIATAMDLNSWNWFSDHAIRDMLPMATLEGATHLEHRLMQIVWPGKHPELEKAATATMKAFVQFVEHFETFCESVDGSDHLRANYSYKRMVFNQNYDYWSRRCEVWSHLNCAYLSRTVLELNIFAERVRSLINPHFFAKQGHFLVFDSMGYRGRNGPFLPELAWVVTITKKWETAQTRILKEAPTSAKGTT